MQIRNYLFIPLVSKGFLEMGINLFPSYPQFIRTNSLSLLRFQYFSNSSSEEPTFNNTPYDVPQTPTAAPTGQVPFRLLSGYKFNQEILNKKHEI